MMGPLWEDAEDQSATSSGRQDIQDGMVAMLIT